jgi:hypothetical protein
MPLALRGDIHSLFEPSRPELYTVGRPYRMPYEIKGQRNETPSVAEKAFIRRLHAMRARFGQAAIAKMRDLLCWQT